MNLRSVSLAGVLGVVAGALVGIAPQFPAAAAAPTVARVDVGTPANIRAGTTMRVRAVARHQALESSDCQRVRWQFTMAVPEQRLNLDDITVVRTENGTLVPMRQSQTSGTVRLTDQRVDDGQLCRGRNVTAVYTVRVPAARTTGTVSVSVEALDLTGQKLGAGSTNINVIAAGEAPQPRKPAPSQGTADDADDDAGVGAGDPVDASIGDGRLASGNLPDSIPVAWLAAGVLTMIFSAGWLITLYRRAR